MSFVRAKKSHQGKKISAKGKPKKKTIKKQAWDDTQSDLSVYKLSKDEVEHRRIIHQSGNITKVKMEKEQKEIARVLRKSPQDSDKSRVTLLREVLYDGDQLQDVLAHTDRVMSVVKDLFGDDPKRYTGLPNVTFAPGQLTKPDRSMLSISQSTEIPHKNDKPDPPILNEITTDSENEEDCEISEIQIEPEKDVNQASNAANSSSLMTPTHESIIQEGLAINDTIKVRKTKKRTVSGDTATAAINASTITDVDGLKRVITGLEQEVEEYERLTGRQRSPKPVKDSEGLGGYTASLLDTITKLVQYLKQSETLLQNESKSRVRLEEGLQEHRALIDVLTSELLTTQDQFLNMQAEFNHYRINTESQLHYVKQMISSVIKTPEGVPSSDLHPITIQQPAHGLYKAFDRQLGYQQTQQQSNLPYQFESQLPPVTIYASQEPHQDNDVIEQDGDSTNELAEQFSSVLSTVPSYVKPLQTAVMISPPRQRDRNTLHKTSEIPVQQLSGESVAVSSSTTEVKVVTMTTTSSNTQAQDFTQQIATLTQQRSDAQARLQSLQSYRRPLSDAGNVNHHVDLLKPTETESVSPSISPIPHERSVGLTKTIAVTMPCVDQLDLSATSTPSPKLQQGKENRLSDVQIKTISNLTTVASGAKTQDSTNAGFFALSSHFKK
ncbi:spindle and centriole-associated protein 1-like [Saccoglossus kowalevskii]|uniref:Spindle and centriole-associated protein 1 n=1 Tax=Saccoglossus kowalevskii TaxID=10224 RepID=A0ABM0M3I6_SACKO|nr:PREDICTED: spindle and centriole-associated protein 1-like [Saccoglossus kowalevskii]